MGARWIDPYLNRWLSPDTLVPDPADPQSLNRYSYGYNNPVKFRDPSGHVPIPVWMKRVADALLFVVAHTRISPGSKPPLEVSPQRQELAKAAGTVAVAADTVATAFSAGGAVAEIAMCMAGAAEPSPIVEGGGLGFYYGFVNRVENATSTIGTVATWGADLASGDTQIGLDSITIGQDSLVSTTSWIVGNQPLLPLEGIGDTAVNVLMLGYDAQRTGGEWPTYVEYRWEGGEVWYIMIYLNTIDPDALPAEVFEEEDE